MRELYRLNKDRFPETGALLYLLKRTDNEVEIKAEMLKLAERVIRETPEIRKTGDILDG